MITNKIIYVIVVTYNGSQWIDKCFESLLKSTVPVKVLAVDNASGDHTVKNIKEKFPWVEIEEINHNLGFGQANNIGIKKALTKGADFVMLLNQDAYVAANTIEQLVECMKNNLELGILSPFHKNYKGTDMELYFKEYIYSTGILTQGKEYYETPFIHAACWLMPVSTIKKVGGFDPLFFHYGEDNDYLQRVKYYGLKAAFISNAILYHQGSNSMLIDKERANKNRILLIAKNPAASEAGILLLFFRSWVKTIGNKVMHRHYAFVLKNWLKIIQARKEQLMLFAYIRH